MNFKFKNLTDLLLTFDTEDKCREYLEQQIWNGKPKCPHCGYNEKAYKLNDGKTYKCGNKECYKKYTVTVHTIAENSNIKLQKWFCAIYLFTAHKKGVSSCQLARDLGVSQKTAWFMLHRIREMMREKAPELLDGQIQIDESYFGGTEKNKHKSRYAQKDKEYMQELGNYDMSKTAVVGLRESTGKVRTKVIPDVSTLSLSLFIDANVKEGVTIVTDEYSGYNSLYKKYNHETVNHKSGTYCYNGFHTNGIENFWSQLKRGIYGIYHQVSPKHLSRYCDEFSYRHNERKISDDYRFTLSLARVTGRLTYKQLIAKDDNQEA